jgi:hypothetical protein
LFAQADEKRDHVEVCAEGGVILEHLAARLEEDGGFALFADYGHDGTKTDTFRVRFTSLSRTSNYCNSSVSYQGLQNKCKFIPSSRKIIFLDLMLQNYKYCSIRLLKRNLTAVLCLVTVRP